MKTKEGKRAISLITLVITIVVMIIISAAVVLTLFGENGIITRAKEARISSDLAVYKEELNMYILNKHTENPSFVNETLTAGEENLVYNTQPQGEKGNIKTVIKSLSDEYLGKLEIIKGELLINTKDKLEIEVAQKLGIEVNPYDIIDGVLISSNGNLLLMDEKTGTLTIPDTVEEIGEGAFSNLSGLKTIIIPSTVKRIAQSAFAYNSTLENVIMQEREKEDGTIEGVEYIGIRAFQDCSNLKTVKMANSVKEIGSQAFYYCTSLQNINISIGIKEVPYYCFCGCKSLTKIEFSEDFKEDVVIGDSAFVDCSNLETVKLSSKVVSIHGNAFSRCAKLKNIEVAKGNKNFKFENGMLLGNEEKEIIILLETAIKNNTIEIPSTVTKLNMNQISGYSNITTLNIPASVIDILFDTTKINLTNVTIDSLNPRYEIYEKAIYTKETTGSIEMLRYFGDEEIVNVKEGTKVIKAYCFSGKNLKEIKLPNSLNSIESQAFQDCKNLKSITLGEKVDSFNNMSIYGSAIEEIKIEEGNENYSVRSGAICNGKVVEALYNKEGSVFISPIKQLGAIETYEIPESVVEGVEVKEIANYAFHVQNKMTDIVIPNTIEKIGYSFNSCRMLEKIEIPESVISINTACFSNASNLKEIRVHKKKGSIIGSPWGCIYGDKAVIWDE